MNKQGLDDESRSSLVNYRIQRAEETFQEAQLLLENDRFIGAVNRLYYACYYASIALLVNNHIPALTHDGVKHQLGLHFVKTGKLPKELSRFYSQLFNNRITGDYDDFVDYKRPMVEAMFENTRIYIDTIKSML